MNMVKQCQRLIKVRHIHHKMLAHWLKGQVFTKELEVLGSIPYDRLVIK